MIERIILKIQIKNKSNEAISDERTNRRQYTKYDHEFKSKLIKMHFLEGVPAHKICDKYSISDGMFSRWRSMFLKAGFERFRYNYSIGDLMTEFQSLRSMNESLKNNLSAARANYELLKTLHDNNIIASINGRYSPKERLHILELISKNSMNMSAASKLLGISRGTISGWRSAYNEHGINGLSNRKRKKMRVWNSLDAETICLINRILSENPLMSATQIRWYLIDNYERYVGFNSVKRIVDNARSPIQQMKESCTPMIKEQYKTSQFHETWQLEFTKLITRRGIDYRVGLIIDEYSQFIIATCICKYPTAETVTDLVDRAIDFASGNNTNIMADTNLITRRTPYLTSSILKDYLSAKGVTISVGDLGRLTTKRMRVVSIRTIKRVYNNKDIESKKDLQKWLDDFVHFYNYQRPHHALNFCTPEDYYVGREREVMAKRYIIRQESPQIKGLTKQNNPLDSMHIS
ncbi:helix-turn-helix domain-containing protein [Candidatus Neomarinimicrobiota bacterium]